MENPTTYLTIQEVAKLFKCTTRTVYRKLDAIGSIETLVDKGLATIEYSTNGNNRRLFKESWIREISKGEQRVKNVKSSDKADWIKVIENQLNIKDEQIKDLTDNNKTQANQIDQLATLLHKAEQRTLELEAHFHLNNMEDSPKLTTTKESIEAQPDSVLSIDINEIDNSDKTMSEWLNQLNKK